MTAAVLSCTRQEIEPAEGVRTKGQIQNDQVGLVPTIEIDALCQIRGQEDWVDRHEPEKVKASLKHNGMVVDYERFHTTACNSEEGREGPGRAIQVGTLPTNFIVN